MKNIKPLFITSVILFLAGVFVLGGCSDLLEELGLIGQDFGENDDNVEDNVEDYVEDYVALDDDYVEGRFFVELPDYGWLNIDILDTGDFVPEHVYFGGNYRYDIRNTDEGEYVLEADNTEYKLLGTVDLDGSKWLAFENGWLCDYSTGTSYRGLLFDAYDEIYGVYNPYDLSPPSSDYLPTHISIGGVYYEVYTPFGSQYSVSFSIDGTNRFAYGFVTINRVFYLVLDNGWLLDYDYIYGYEPYDFIYHQTSLMFYHHSNGVYTELPSPTPQAPEEPVENGPEVVSRPDPPETETETETEPVVPTGQPDPLTDTDGDGMLEIQTVEHLESISATDDSLKAAYELANDIDLSNEDWTPIGYLNPSSFSLFTGILEGNGYRIHGLTTSGKSSGLFEQIGEDAIVRNLRLEATLQSVASSNSTGIGVLGRWAHKGSIIANVSVSFTVDISSEDKNTVGGIVGRSTNAFTLNSFAQGSIVGGSEVDILGGLIGRLHGGTLRGNLANVAVNGGASSDMVGGLIGYANHTSSRPLALTGNYATGAVSGGSDSVIDLVGGIIARLSDPERAATIADNYYSGLVTTNTGETLTSVAGISFDDGGSRKPTLTFVEHAETNAENAGSYTADCTPVGTTRGALDPPTCGTAMSTN